MTIKRNIFFIQLYHVRFNNGFNKVNCVVMYEIRTNTRKRISQYSQRTWVPIIKLNRSDKFKCNYNPY